MDLYEIESEEEMVEALEEGDEELERQLELEARAAVINALSDPHYDYEFGGESVAFLMDPDSAIAAGKLAEIEEELLEKAIRGAWNEEEAEVIFRSIPPEVVREAVQRMLENAADTYAENLAGKRWRDTSGPFSIAVGGYRDPTHVKLAPLYYEVSVFFDEPVAWVPEKKMVDLLSQELEAEWEQIDDGLFSSGWIEDSESDIGVKFKAGEAYEWLMDLHREWVDKKISEDPKFAIKFMLNEIKESDFELHDKIKKAKLPQDVLESYAVAYFENPNEGMFILREAMGYFGYENSRAETILEFGHDDLERIGVTQGLWWDRSPWRLVNLPPEELAYEGTMQRHCVGRHDMGYRERVASEEIQIWSLRDRQNRPVLTFEVNLENWEGAETPEERGLAVRQLKGKLNRVAGDTDKGRKQRGRPPNDKDIDEILVLTEIVFPELGILPNTVSDFMGLNDRRQRNSRRSSRTFDEPSRP